MTETEKTEILEQLAGGQAALLDALAGVSEADARRAPGPDRWSILQCVEHVAIVEEYLLERILAATESPAPLHNAAREARIRAIAPDRSRRVPAPAVGLPADRYRSLDAALGAFLAGRERTIRFVESCGADLRARITTHPIAGTVNCYETLLMMAPHPLRHAGQIREIRAALAP